MRDHLDEYGDALPVVITFIDDPERLAAYRTLLALPFPVLSDADRVLYRLFGAGRGTFRQVWSAGTLAMYGRLLRRGRRLRMPADDTRQLGADAVIDRMGRLHALWLPPSPDRRPPVADLVAALATVPEL